MTANQLFGLVAEHSRHRRAHIRVRTAPVHEADDIRTLFDESTKSPLSRRQLVPCLDTLSDITNDVAVFRHPAPCVANNSCRLLHPRNTSVFSSSAELACGIESSVLGSGLIKSQHPRPVLGGDEAEKRLSDDVVRQVARLRKEIRACVDDCAPLVPHEVQFADIFHEIAVQFFALSERPVGMPAFCEVDDRAEHFGIIDFVAGDHRPLQEDVLSFPRNCPVKIFALKRGIVRRDGHKLADECLMDLIAEDSVQPAEKILFAPRMEQLQRRLVNVEDFHHPRTRGDLLRMVCEIAFEIIHSGLAQPVEISFHFGEILLPKRDR